MEDKVVEGEGGGRRWREGGREGGWSEKEGKKAVFCCGGPEACTVPLIDLAQWDL